MATKKKIHPAVSEYYRSLQKKSRDSLNRKLIERAKELQRSGELKTGV